MEGPEKDDMDEKHLYMDGAEDEMVAEEDYMQQVDGKEPILVEEEVVEEEDVGSAGDLYDDIAVMRVPNDPVIRPLYNIYRPSSQVENLLSEKNRTVYAEWFKEKTISALFKVPKLSELAMNVLLQTYTGGNLNPKIQGELRTIFGEKLDINLPLQDILDLDIEAYWKRVFLNKCKDKFLISLKTNSTDEDWKGLAVREKLRELIENSTFEEWYDDEIQQLARKITNYITELKISQLVPLEEYSISKDRNLVDYKIYNYPPEDCHHINLGILGEFKNLVSLHFEFQPPLLGYKYDSRFFNFSYLDMENLARALKKLQVLREFSLCRSRMDNRKLKILMEALVSLNSLEFLNLSYCQLNDDTAWTITTYLEKVSSLKTLKLEGNNLNTRGICTLFYGIQNYEGFLEYVSIARNPVGDDGVKYIGCALNNARQISHLNLNGILVTEYGATLVAEIVKMPTALVNIEMCALPLGKLGGKHLIDSLDKNKNILKLEYRGCDLTEKQKFKIKLLLMRNDYLQKVPFTSMVVENHEEMKKLNKDIENCISATKQPVLLNVLKTLEEEVQCKETEHKTTVFPLNVPKFIPKMAQIQKTNKELLGEYYDIPLEDWKIRESRGKATERKFVYDANSIQNREEFLKYIDNGMATVEYPSDYFNPRGYSTQD